MRIIGIDYGSRRVGIALSDPDKKIGLPHSVIENGSDMTGLIINIEAIAEENKATDIVIGESTDYKGQANKIMPAILELKKHLEADGYVIHMEPEFMTSVQAERFQGKNDMSDAAAAALILQSYLDRKGENL